jgi:hypothetical protein
MERSGILAEARLPGCRFGRYWKHKIDRILGLDGQAAESPSPAKPSRFKRTWEPKAGTYRGLVD